MTRRESREAAMIAVYEMSVNKNELDEVVLSADEAETYKLDKYSKKVAQVVFDNLQTIDSAIEAKLNKRTLSRVPLISLAIMRVCCAEMMFFEDVPNNISINEAVTLAKKFCADDYTYVNAILGAICSDIEAAQEVTE